MFNSLGGLFKKKPDKSKNMAAIHPTMLVKNDVKSSQTPAHFLNVDYFKKFL